MHATACIIFTFPNKMLTILVKFSKDKHWYSFMFTHTAIDIFVILDFSMFFIKNSFFPWIQWFKLNALVYDYWNSCAAGLLFVHFILHIYISCTHIYMHIMKDYNSTVRLSVTISSLDLNPGYMIETDMQNGT